jgi:hypothetical protein
MSGNSDAQSHSLVPRASVSSLGGHTNGVYEDGTVASDDEALTDAVGQLSLNEDAQVRYHGKASGLHLLGQKPRVDRRNEGGIWCAWFTTLFSSLKF